MVRIERRLLEILDDGGIRNTQTGLDIYNVAIIGTRSLQLAVKSIITEICLRSVDLLIISYFTFNLL